MVDRSQAFALSRARAQQTNTQLYPHPTPAVKQVGLGLTANLHNLFKCVASWSTCISKPI